MDKKLTGANILIEPAIFWWESKRPIDWDLDMHLDSPSINCATLAEDRLARSIAIIIKEYKIQTSKKD